MKMQPTLERALAAAVQVMGRHWRRRARAE